MAQLAFNSGNSGGVYTTFLPSQVVDAHRHAYPSDCTRYPITKYTRVLQEELAGQKFNDLYEYYRSVYCRVTEDDIVKFQESYRHSEEESTSLDSLYERFKGDMQM